MWLALSAQHLEQAQDNWYDLQDRFYEYQQKAGNYMKLHIAEIKSLANHLEEVGRPVDERQLITKIVCTLPSAYRPFVSSWRHSPVERQNLVTLTSLLLQKEREIAKWVPKRIMEKTVPFKPSNPHRGPLWVVAIIIMNVKMAREEDIKEMAVEVIILIVVEINRIVMAITDKMANNRGIVLIVT